MTYSPTLLIFILSTFLLTLPTTSSFAMHSGVARSGAARHAAQARTARPRSAAPAARRQQAEARPRHTRETRPSDYELIAKRDLTTEEVSVVAESLLRDSRLSTPVGSTIAPLNPRRMREAVRAVNEKASAPHHWWLRKKLITKRVDTAEKAFVFDWWMQARFNKGWNNAGNLAEGALIAPLVAGIAQQGLKSRRIRKQGIVPFRRANEAGVRYHPSTIVNHYLNGREAHKNIFGY